MHSKISIMTICLIAVACNAPVSAANIRWQGNVSAGWNNAGNWLGTLPTGSDIIYFGNDANKAGVVKNPDQSLNADFSVKGIVANNTNNMSISAGAAAYKLSLGSAGIDMTQRDCANLIINAEVALLASQLWNIADLRSLQVSKLNLGAAELKLNLNGLNSNIVFNDQISGSGSLNIAEGSKGTLVLAGDNNFSGGITLRSGTLRLAHARALGSGAVSVSGGRIDFNGQAANNLINVSNGSVIGGTQYTGSIRSNGGLTIGGNYNSLDIDQRVNQGVSVSGQLGLNMLGGRGEFSGGAVTVNQRLLSTNTIDGLLFNNGLNLKASSVCNFEIGGLDRGRNYDAVNISGGTFTLDGKITLVAYQNFQFSQLRAGDSIQLFDWRGASLVNNLVEFDFSNAKLSAGLGWDVSAFYSSGMVKVSNIPEPGSSMLCAVGATRLLLRRRRRLS